MLWTMCLNSLFPVYFLSVCWCSVTLWQPTVFYSVLVLYLRTQSILKRKNLKELQQPFCDLLLFCNQFCAFSQRTVQLIVKLISFNWNCGICLSERNIVCILSCNVLTFHQSFFHSCSSVVFQPSTEKAFQALLKVLLQT